MRAKPLDPTVEEARDQRWGTALVLAAAALIAAVPALLIWAIVYAVVR